MSNERPGFSYAPGKFSPDPGIVFVHRSYEEAFATVRYGIEARKGLIVLTGVAGVGKTTLLKKLIASLAASVQTALIYDARLNFPDLMQSALKDFGLPNSRGNRLAIMGQFYDYLERQLERSRIVSLLVDDAQNLSDETLEELRLLSNLETHTEKLLQIVLVGQSEFEEKLDRSELFPLKQRVVLRCRLRALDEFEVGSYIDSRVERIRHTRQDLFDAEAIARIAFYSRGVPRLINVICDHALLVASESHKSRVTAAIIEAVVDDLNSFECPRRVMQTSESDLASGLG
jgi:type II secretory pathway predicted ATPase ExeA